LTGDRFTVGTVTGWPITETTLYSARAFRMKPTTLAYVYDLAYGYREIASFDNRGGYTAETKARALADRLNAEERAQ
jgi:hypothetical protein